MQAGRRFVRPQRLMLSGLFLLGVVLGVGYYGFRARVPSSAVKAQLVSAIQEAELTSPRVLVKDANGAAPSYWAPSFTQATTAAVYRRVLYLNNARPQGQLCRIDKLALLDDLTEIVGTAWISVRGPLGGVERQRLNVSVPIRHFKYRLGDA